MGPDFSRLRPPHARWSRSTNRTRLIGGYLTLLFLLLNIVKMNEAEELTSSHFFVSKRKRIKKDSDRRRRSVLGRSVGVARDKGVDAAVT